MGPLFVSKLYIQLFETTFPYFRGMKQLAFGHYLMVNDAELCELGWEVMVVFLGFFLQVWMIPREW